MKYAKDEPYAVVENNGTWFVLTEYGMFMTADETKLPPKSQQAARIKNIEDANEQIQLVIAALRNAVTVPVNSGYTFRLLKLAKSEYFFYQHTFKIICTPRWLKIEGVGDGGSMEAQLWAGENPDLKNVDGHWCERTVSAMISKTPKTLEIGIVPLDSTRKFIVFKTEHGTYGIVNYLPPEVAA